MTVAVAVVTASTVIGEQDITTTDLNGSTPKAVVFLYSRVGADGAVRTDDMAIQIGMATATHQAAIAVTTRSGITSHLDLENGRTGKTTKCIIALVWDGMFEVHSEAGFVSFIPDGVRVDWTTASPDGWMVSAMFFEGAEWEVAITDHCPVDTTGVSVTTGFRPDGLVMIGSGDLMDGAIATSPSRHVTGFGFCTWFGGIVSSVFSNYFKYPISKQLIHSNGVSGGTTPNCAGHWELFTTYYNVITSRFATGFTVKTSNTTTTDRYATLALKFTGDGQLKCGSFRISSSGVGDQAYVGFGGRIKQFMFLNGKQTTDYAQQNDWRDHFALVTPVKIGGYAFGGENVGSVGPATPTLQSNTHFTDKIRMLDSSGLGVENAVCTLKSFDGDGLTLNWTDPPQFRPDLHVSFHAWDWFYLTIVDTTENLRRNQAWIIDG